MSISTVGLVYIRLREGLRLVLGVELWLLVLGDDGQEAQFY